MPFTRPRHWLRWLIGAIVVLAEFLLVFNKA